MSDKKLAFVDRLRDLAFHNAHKGLSEVAVDLQGWISGAFDDAFKALLMHVQRSRGGGSGEEMRPLVILEVGVWKGLSTSRMASISKALGIPVKIIAIDTWLGAPEFWTWGLEKSDKERDLKMKYGYPQVYYTFLKNMRELGHGDVVCPLPLPSAQAAEVLRYYGVKADIVYVDAAHEYEAVAQDIGGYWELLREGGVMFGDDYSQYWPGVVRAVDEASARLGVEKHVDDILWTLAKNSVIVCKGDGRVCG